MGWRSSWAALAVTSVARALLTTVVALALVTIVPTALGWSPAVVMSGSMEPVLQVGDVVICRPVPTSELRMGQILLVDDPDHAGRLRLHRLVGATPTGRLVLRGDRNEHADSSSVDVAAVRGIVSLRVPLIGHPFVWAEKGQVDALALAAAVATLLLAGCFLFRAEESIDRRPPARSKPHRRRRHLRRRRVRAAAGGIAALVIAASTAVPATAAPFSGTTSNSGDSYSASARFKCSDRFSADAPIDYWKLSEPSGAAATDQTAARPGTYSPTGVTYGDAGPCPADDDSAVTLNGASGVGVTTSVPISPAAIASFTEEIAFKTTSTTGGLLMGLWDSSASVSGTPDRVLAMSTSGQIVFGMVDTTTQSGATATSSASYNDGVWHLAAATYSPTSGMTLYVDGVAVGASPPLTESAAGSGYWRIGFGHLDSTIWPTGGAADAFTGSLADAVVYATALSATRIGNHDQALADAQNYAEGRPASQSSSALGADASLADDGNTDGDYADGSVTHTNQDPFSWWQVDLGYTLTTSQIQIWNRTDCCGSRLTDYWVFVSEIPFDTSLSPTQQAAVSGVWSSHQTSAPSPSTSLAPPAGTRGRYVMVQEGTPNENLSLAEVRVYGSAPRAPGIDLALSTAATQSSTTFGGVPTKAVDGDTDGVYNDGSVSHTDDDYPYAWWQTDLASSKQIGSIDIWNRTDPTTGSRLSDYWVFASDTPFDTSLSPAAQSAQPGVWSAHLTSSPSPMARVILPNGTTARYVMVQQQTTYAYLSLAEVQVFGP